jgi:hypothetical protein
MASPVSASNFSSIQEKSSVVVVYLRHNALSHSEVQTLPRKGSVPQTSANYFIIAKAVPLELART